jgi:uncharacterized protein YndB with AHSA1/START domain
MDYTEKQELVITRELDASRDRVWAAWTDAKALAQWWGPKGSKIEVAKCEIRPGGVFHYSMEMQGGPMAKMWGKFTFGEVVPPEKLVFVSGFSDESGAMTPNPWLPVWPLEIRNTLTLEEEDGKTTLTLRGGPVNCTQEELDAFVANRANMQGGFAGSFEQLDAYLASSAE